MKFIFLLDLHSSMEPTRLNLFGQFSREDFYYCVRSVFGPYEDWPAVEEALSRLSNLYRKNKITDVKFLVFDGLMLDMKPSPKEKVEDEKKCEQKSDDEVIQAMNQEPPRLLIRTMIIPDIMIINGERQQKE